MPKRNAIPILSLALIAFLALYLWAISGQPRMADGVLSGGEMSLWEKALAIALPLSVFASMVIALHRAKRAGSWFWFLVCLFLWPATFLYVLVVNRGDEA